MKLSERIGRLKTSPVRKLIPYGEEAVKKGKKIIHLNIGQPDIETPRVFFDAIANYQEKVLSYAHSAGLVELRKGIQGYYQRRDMSYALDDILITAGGSEAFLFIFMSLFDELDEILIPDPYYANYNSYFSTLNIIPRVIHTHAEDGYHLPSLEEMEKSITPKTKAIMFSNPSNPTGVVYAKEELDRFAQLAKKHNLFIISDEVYREFTYGENKAISFGTYKDLDENVIIIDSISKRYSACGARVGCIISKNKDFMAAIYKQCQARLAMPTLDMIGATQLYALPDSLLEEFRVQYEKRRNTLYTELQKIPDIVVSEPEGAFYVFVKLPITNAEEFVIWLLTEFDIDGETVMFAPGEGFYANPELGKDKIRICYALEEKVLKKAMHIFKEGLVKYLSLKNI